MKLFYVLLLTILKSFSVYCQNDERTAARTMQLQTSQFYELMDYIHETRKQMLVFYGETSDQLFINLGKGEIFTALHRGL